MAQFDFYLNRQGVRGPQGIQGEQGFSPIITVATNTLSEYVLQIQTQNNTFLTANLREHKEDLGGTYIRYNRETGVMFAGDADVASQSQMGVVRFAASSDIEREAEDCVVSPADVVDMIPSGDISNLQDRVTTLEGKTESLEGNVSDNSLAISELQSSVSGLLANYVPKTRTINGYALSSNITLTASDVNAYSKSETDVLLADKADVSDLPDMNNYYNTTQIDSMLNDKADISDIPTVGNGTITFTQGGVIKGTITTNQSGDSTIALDAGGSQYILPAATTSTLGGVIVDGTTITVDSNGVITSVGGGGGGTTYNPGDGININSSTNTISAKPDGTTIDFNTSGELKVISAPTPNNMVTTDTAQTISGTKTFNTVSADYITASNTLYSSQVVSPSPSDTAMSIHYGDGNDILRANRYSGVNKLFLGNTTDFNYIIDQSANGIVDKNNNSYLTSANVGNYALTSLPIATTSALGGVIPDGTTITVDADGTIHGASTYVLPTASTSTLGGVKVDGTTITIDNNGVISSSGGGSSYTAGTGIDITNDVISVDSTVATQTDLEEKQDAFESVAPLSLAQASKIGNVYKYGQNVIVDDGIVQEKVNIIDYQISTSALPTVDFSKPWELRINNVVFSGQSTVTLCYINTGEQNTSFSINMSATNSLHARAYQPNGTYSERTVTITPSASYDLAIAYDGSAVRCLYKLSSSDTFAEITGYRSILSNANSNQRYIYIGASPSRAPINTNNVTFTNDGNTLFARIPSQLSLSIGTGLSVVNGALTATATPVTVDQTYNASSTNAQSGTAVAGAIANKVTGTGITNMVALTQAQYDALATKDANTFYVIVAASNS